MQAMPGRPFAAELELDWNAVIGTANKNEHDQGFFVKWGDGGADVVIADFEDVDPGVETLFQEPTNSGSTSADLMALPSASDGKR